MTHCAQAGTLSPRTTEPPVVHKELAEVLANPVIAVVRSVEELAEALTSRVSAIEIRSGDLASLPALIDRVRAARKSVLLYPELIAGLGRDPAAIDFLCGYARPTAIVSTKKQILQKARACGLITIFQIFMIDTQAFETGISDRPQARLRRRRDHARRDSAHYPGGFQSAAFACALRRTD